MLFRSKQQAKMYDKETGEEKQEEDDVSDDEWEAATNKNIEQEASCKGLTEELCNKLKHCLYSKGTKRQFCRHKSKHKTKKQSTPKSASKKQSSLQKSLKCKGLNEVDCNKLYECIYTKGAKRQYCRTKKNK